MKVFLALGFFFCCICLIAGQPYYGYSSNYGGQKDAVLLQNVKVLTLERGKMTRGRRSAPIPQLQSVGGTAQGRYDLEPAVVQCYNQGPDSSGEFQWKCEADLDSSVKFGRISVSCEGYSDPDDPYVLSGSCGLEYELDYTQQGWQNQRYGGNSYSNNYHHNYSYEGHNSGGLAKFFMFVILAMVVGGLVRQCMQNSRANGRPYGGGYGGNGHYPGGYPPGPPPPYNPDSCGPSPSYGTGNTWRPGFWTGLGAGGMLSYLFRPRYGGGYGGYSGYGGYNRPFGGSPSYGGSSGHTPSFTRSSSGYGGTRRR